MKLFAKCSAFASLSFQEHVKVCNPIPLKNTIRFATARAHTGQSGSTQPFDKVFQCVAIVRSTEIIRI